MGDTTDTTVTTETTRSDSLISLTLPIATKLNLSNYLTWKCQILPIIHGYNLSNFISSPPPSPTSPGSDGQIIINPEYLPWHRQDQLLLGWIRSSLTEEIQSQMVSCTTSAELWSSLQNSFASTSKARMLDLKRQIQHTSRGSSTCSEYLLKMRKLADELAFIGAPIPDEELISNIINGLGIDYNPFFASIAAASRHETFSFSDLQGLLLGFESLLRNQTSSSGSLSSFSPPSAFATNTGMRPSPAGTMYQNTGNFYQSPRPNSYQPRPPYARGYQPRPRPPFNQNTPHFNPNPRPSGPRQPYTPPTGPVQPRPPRPAVNTSTKQFCQICNKFGIHTAKNCWFRYNEDESWTPPSSNFAPQAYVASQVTDTSQPSAYTASPSSSEWILDTGATNHVTSDLNNLSSFFNYEGNDSLHLGNGLSLPITHIGSSTFNLSSHCLKLTNILVVPSFKKNLISMSQLLTDNPHLLIEFHSLSCLFKDCHTKALLHMVPCINGLFCLFFPSLLPQAFNSSKVPADIWHARLGHPSSATTSRVLNNFSLPCTSHKLSNCHDCAMAKSHVLPFSLSTTSSSKPLELIHSDVWGPAPVCSSNGFRYYVLFVDDFTKYTWIFFMSHKHQVSGIFSLFKQQIENQLSETIKTLRTDGGLEYKPIEKQFPQIIHQLSCPYTPQQNGTSERKHRHIIELSLAIMSKASVPHMYWDEMFANAVYLINRLPAVSSSLIPYTSLFNKQPDYSLLKVIGCLCFPHTRPYNSHKLELRALPCVFLGYSNNQKGYRCLHIATNRIYTSRNVDFDEQVFPFKQGSDASSNSTAINSNFNSLQASPLLDLYLRGIPSPPTGPSNTSLSPANNSSEPTLHSGPFSPFPTAQPVSPLNSNTTQTQQTHPTQPSPILPLPDPVLNSPTRSDRSSTPLPQQQTSSLSAAPSHPMVTRTRDNTRQPRKFPDHVAFLAASSVEPTSFTQANSHPEWRAAMAKELNALAYNQTWKLVPAPADQRVVGCKWVFKIKRHSDGTIERYKARLVAKGYHQQEGIDFLDTFSPVVRPTTIRLILSISVTNQWSIKQLDVQNAFLHGDLTEKVYMTQPPGFIDSSKPNHVCLLSKAINGLKQSPRAWFHKLSQALIDFGFTASHYDPSLFFAHVQGQLIIVLVYVDDIIITGSDNSMISNCIAQLNTRFAIKDLGPLHYFLGIAVNNNSKGMHLSQSKYIKDLLQRTNMLSAKPTTTPLATDMALFPGDSEPFSDPHLYRSTVGALQYATVTRPDISFAVNKLSQFMHSPTSNQWMAVKHVLRYLSGTLHHGLQFHAKSDAQLHAYTDADWAGSSFDRRSTSGYSIFWGHNLISWSAKKQPTVARSSTEAEYRSLALACAELLWVQYLIQELHFHLYQPPIIWCDNIGATFLASNPMFHSGTKHVEIDFHFVREKVAAKSLCVRYLCSADQLADIFTKPLSTNRFTLLRDKLNVTSVPLAWGGY
ncbi:hypothetical protein LUZ61_001914 [Rhynchospora tenuis]|uniref:Integrase catalytic domain-containing protein n=1 Tax=Rhynchospora tenuis TaxID=198213 RepID=A0AAD5ZHX3_9POAL|nr:hypothetical protein LUZ61_001914 [Rhynchospora tenuis]